MSGTPSNKNRFILAAAGSGKTTALVDEALAHPQKRILVTTYTLENVAQLNDYFVDRVGCVPANITINSWYTLLIRDGARPYQRDVLASAPRIASVYFEKVPDTVGFPKKTEVRYFLTQGGLIYRDRLSDFVVLANSASGGAVIGRLEEIYDIILIDEVQDMAGFDLDVLELLFASKIPVVCAGDLRQATYNTNDHLRHKQYRGQAMIAWIRLQEKAGRISIEERNDSHRCNPEICAFANQIFPNMPPSVSRNEKRTGHDGIHFVAEEEVAAYVAAYTPSPVVLRYDRRNKAMDLPAINFGASKGRNYDRVLIFPTAGIRKYLTSGKVEDIGDREKFYVAVTRARYSVAFVTNKTR